MATMKVGTRIIGTGQQALVLAEEGQANQGNIELALQMCSISSSAGADGIEFQLFLADDMYVRRDPGHAIYKARELDKGQIRELIQEARRQGLICQVAGLSPEIIELCSNAEVDIFTVNSTDLTNPLIIDPITASGKPFWLATLMATLDEIDWSVEYASSRAEANFGLLHGQHVMSSDLVKGVPPDLLQLDCIEMIRRRYGLVIGFVDHTATKFAAAFAALKGAALITKHLSPYSGWEGPDSIVCLDPGEFTEMVQMVRYADLVGGASKDISQAEINDKSLHRRSVYTSKGLKGGHVLTMNDLVALRPGKDGIDPRFIQSLVGRRLIHDVPEQHQLRPVDVSETKSE